MSKDTATFSRDSARRISEVVREVERSRTVGRDRPGRPPRPTYDNPVRGQQFVAKIVGEGPEGADDFDDARYWVREVSLETLEVLDNGRWLIAVNLCEMGSSHHMLRRVVPGGDTIPDRFVVIATLSPAAAYGHVFNSYPGQMTELWGYKVNCLDADGCPEGEWYQMHGPGFVVAATPQACTPEPGA